MQQLRRSLSLMVAALALGASLAQAGATQLTLQPGSKLWLNGSSNVHEYSSTASKLSVTFQHDPARWVVGATGGEAVERLIRDGGVTSMDVVVAVTGLHSGKDGLDRNMYKALKAEKCPEIRFRMAGYQHVVGATPAETKIAAKGTLSIAGVDREIQMDVIALREGETVRLRGSASLLMTQFGIKPPTMMMGALRTADKVVVNFDLLVGAKDVAGPVSQAE